MKLPKKAELIGTVSIVLAAVLLVLIGSAIITDTKGPTVTGAVTFNPLCEQNVESCIDLNGDGRITYDDEDIFAQILLGTITNESDPQTYHMADFDNDGNVDNEVDFQQCFVVQRDFYIDFRDRQVPCNPAAENNRTNRTNHTICTHGCADLDGDGRVNDTDFNILTNSSVWGKNASETNYPMADLDGDGVVDQVDKDCLRPYMDKIVMCNLPNQANLSDGRCPDLTDEFETSNDGFVDEHDKALFDQYYEEEDERADLNGDGYIDWLDEYMFDSYMGKIVDCNLYHAPWHTGGIDQNNSNTSVSNTYLISNWSNARQSFQAGRDGQLTKIRFFMEYNEGNQSDINVILHPDINGTANVPNTTVIIAKSIIDGFKSNDSHWVTAKFKIPPTIEEGNFYHIAVNLSSQNGSYLWYVGSDIVNGTSAFNEWNPPPSGFSTLNDTIFEVYSTTACADFDGDGYVDEDDEAIIEDIPDNITPEGSASWNETYDLNDDKIIDEKDTAILDGLNQGRVQPKELCEGSGPDIGIDNNTAISQAFNATFDELYFVNVTLRRQDEPITDDIDDIAVEIRSADGSRVDLTEDGLLDSRTIIKNSVNTTFENYLLYFENGVSLNIGDKYFIRVISENTNFNDYYYWESDDSNDCYGGTGYNASRDNTTTLTEFMNRDMVFTVYEGNTFEDDFNDSLDVNEDDWINATDYNLVNGSVISYDPTWWLALADFNAIYNVYEKLRDKTLGFDSYMTKALKCGLPRYDEYCGNGRCDDDEDFITCENDCPECNEDGFCAKSENFTGCSDCVYPPAQPRYRKFNGSTTDFSAEDDIGKVPNATLEILPYGKIEFEGHTLNFSGLDLDEYVGIGRGWVEINTSGQGMDRLNTSANITLYNLSFYKPRILVDGENCTEPKCTILDYPGSDECESDCTIRIRVTHFTRYTVIENDTSTQFINGPIPNIVFDENEEYNLSLPSIDNYFFDADNSTLIYGYNSSTPNITVRFFDSDGIENNTRPSVTRIYAEPFYSGESKINFSASDGTTTAWSTPPTTVTVKPNIPPQQAQLLPKKIQWDEDNNYTLDINGVFIDGDGDDIMYFPHFIGSSSGMNIQFNNSNHSVRFIPETNINGEWFVIINASDEEYNVSASDYIHLIVNSINDLPILSPIINDEVIDEDTNTSIIDLNNHFFDVEDNKSGVNITYYLNWTSDNFTYNFTVNGTHLQFFPIEHWNGNERFVVIAKDSDGGETLSNNFTIFVLPIPDPLERTNKTFNLTWLEDNNLSLNLSDYFYDPDQSTVYRWNAAWKNDPQKNMSVEIETSTGEVKLIPKANWTGNISINFSAEDTSGVIWEDTTLNVTPINDPPKIDISVLYVREDSFNDTINLSDYVMDVDHPDEMINWSIAGLFNVNAVIDNLTKMLNITTNLTNWNGNETAVFTAYDPENQSSENATIVILAVNDRPIVNFSSLGVFSVGEDTNNDILDLDDHVSDVEDNNSVLVWNCTTDNINTTVMIDNITNRMNFSTFNNFSGLVNITCIATDTENATGNDSLTMNITRVNDPPYWNYNWTNFTWQEDTPYIINISSLWIEVDGDNMTFQQGEVSSITKSYNSTTTIFTLTPDANFSGIRNMIFNATDHTGLVSEQINAVLNVTNINDRPTLSLENKTAIVNTTFIYDVSAAAEDVDIGDILSYIDNASAFDINSTTGMIVWTPTSVRNETVTITLCDNSMAVNNCTGEQFTIRVVNATNSTFIQSYVNNTYYHGNYSNVTGVLFSTINISNILGPEIYVEDSTLLNTNMSNSTVYPISHLIDSRVQDSNVENCTMEDSVLNESYCKRSTMIVSDLVGRESGLEDSYLVKTSVINSTVINNSDLRNSTIIRSPINNCTIYDSDMEDTLCEGAFIDPSSIKRSNTTGSTITNSHIWDSNTTYSRINNATIDYTSANNCSISNSTLRRTTVMNCNITNDMIYSGTITYPNGTIYDASINGAKGLNNFINYPPIARIVANPTSGTTSIDTIFNGSISSDPNAGTDLDDFLNYTWDFDSSDGIQEDANGIDANKTYTTGTYTATLIVNDSYGEKDNTTVTITVSSAGGGGSGGGGGGGSGGGGGGGSGGGSSSTSSAGPTGDVVLCTPDWTCSAWSPEVCPIDGIQTRECGDWNKCGNDRLMPPTNRTCDYIEPVHAESCYDNIRNQGEERTDCGGPCRPCPPLRPTVQAPSTITPEETTTDYTWAYIVGIIATLGVLGAIGAVGAKPLAQALSPEVSYRKKIEAYMIARLQEGYSERVIVEKLVEQKVPDHLINEALINIKK